MGISPVLGMIMEEFNISYATAGALFSTVFYSYTLMQLPSGYLGDRFGRKKILIIGTSLWFFLGIATALVQTFTALLVVRFFTGIAHGVYFGNDRPTITAVTPKEKMGFGQGISFMGLAIGFFISIFLSGIIAEYTQSWRSVFLIFSIPSLITCILIIKYLKKETPSSGETKTSLITAYRKVLVVRELWLMYLLGFVMLYGYWLIASWMPSIFQEIGFGEIKTSSMFSALLGLIGVPGLLFCGALNDRIVKKGDEGKWIIAIFVFIWALLMFFTGYAVEKGASTTLISVLFFSSGFVIFGVWSPYYALLSRLAPVEVSGTAFGVANFIGFLSAWIAPHLTGWIKDTTGSFSLGLYVAGFLLVLGLIITLALRPPSLNKTDVSESGLD
jgi:MFS family permease